MMSSGKLCFRKPSEKLGLMFFAEQNKRIHIGGGGGGEGDRKIVLFYKEPTNDYKLALIFCLLKFYGKAKRKTKP